MHSNADVYPSGNKVIMGDFNGANVCDSSGRPRQHYPPPPPSIHSYYYGHRRTGQHPLGGGGQTDFCPNGFRRWGGGGSSRNFPGSIICGGKVVGDIFRGPCAPDSVCVWGGGGNGSIFSVNCSNIP